MSKEDEFYALVERVSALERARILGEHEHVWRYSKTVTVGRGVLWSWECTGWEVCGRAQSGTNRMSGLPPHFPDELR